VFYFTRKTLERFVDQLEVERDYSEKEIVTFRDRIGRLAFDKHDCVSIQSVDVAFMEHSKLTDRLTLEWLRRVS